MFYFSGRSLVLATTGATLSVSKWYTLGLEIKGTQVTATLGGKTIINVPIKTMPSKNGFVAIGTEEFSRAYFDNFKVKSAKIEENPEEPQYRYYNEHKASDLNV